MKPNKIDYYDGKKLSFKYEYRGFIYSIEAKDALREYGLIISKCIDNYIDKGINFISLRSDVESLTFQFYSGEDKRIDVQRSLINEQSKLYA